MFPGTWDCRFRSWQCDPVICFARAGRWAGLVLSKGAAKKRAFGRDRAPALVVSGDWRQTFSPPPETITVDRLLQMLYHW